MKVFNKGEENTEKVNFIDRNNVFVGYDLGQSCCERADWFISQSKDDKPIDGNGIDKNLEDYYFDITYFEEIEPYVEGSKSYKCSCFDEGNMVRFRLKADNKPYLYLHLYNCHNGYYGHGFEAKIGGQVWQRGNL